MILSVQFCAALLGLLAVILGAFGAHRLRKFFSAEQMSSFETGVKYQFYHALLLLVLGFNLGLTTALERYMAWSFILGTTLFSFSIYGLCYLGAKGKKIPLLGLVTPIGGFLLASGWVLLLYSFIAHLV